VVKAERGGTLLKEIKRERNGKEKWAKVGIGTGGHHLVRSGRPTEVVVKNAKSKWDNGGPEIGYTRKNPPGGGYR